MDTWDFDVFKLAEYTGNRPLMSITYTILQVKRLFGNLFKNVISNASGLYEGEGRG